MSEVSVSLRDIGMPELPERVDDRFADFLACGDLATIDPLGQEVNDRRSKFLGNETGVFVVQRFDGREDAAGEFARIERDDRTISFANPRNRFRRRLREMLWPQQRHPVSSCLIHS